MRLTRLVLLLTALSAPSFAQAKTWKGTVVDGVTETGLENVEIYPLDSRGKVRSNTPINTLTGGRFVLTSSSRSTRFRFIKNGYAPYPFEASFGTTQVVHLWPNAEDDATASSLASRLKERAAAQPDAAAFYTNQEEYFRSTVNLSPVLMTKVAAKLNALEGPEAGTKLRAFAPYARANPAEVAAFQRRIDGAIKDGTPVPGPDETHLDPKIVRAIAAFRLKASDGGTASDEFRVKYKRLWGDDPAGGRDRRPPNKSGAAYGLTD